jgi:hypothetical protein
MRVACQSLRVRPNKQRRKTTTTTTTTTTTNKQ